MSETVANKWMEAMTSSAISRVSQPSISGALLVTAHPRRSATMRALLLSLALGCAAVTGCSRSGDLGVLVVGEVVRYGGHAKTNGVIPTLQARWTIKRDRNGFQAWATGVPFAKVDDMMRQAFGAPKMTHEGNETATGQPHRVWGAADIGVAIQLIGRTNGADIICVRAMRDTKEMLREMNRPWWRFW